VFTFDTVRTFHRVDIHTNNHFSKDIQIFRKAKIYFSNEVSLETLIIVEIVFKDKKVSVC